MRKKNSKKLVIGIFFLSIFFLGLFQNLNISYAQEHSETINFSQSFQIDEFSENSGTQENVTSIDIDLGSSRWNVTDIELNFTNIKLERQTKSIEDSEEGFQYKTINKDHPVKNYVGLGVEIYLPVNTTIYGVYIYGYKQLTTEEVYVQIRDYDDVTDEPTTNFHHNQTLNISTIPGWYIQNFSDSVSLSAGKYYLVLINEDYNDLARHFWGYTTTPNNLSLHRSEFYTDGDIWANTQPSLPFLYKLIQKTNNTYKPTDIKMAVRINDKNYNVTDGLETGSGNVNMSVNYSPGDDILHIPIVNNISATLNFTLEYRINLNNSFYVDGNVLLIENAINNQWEIEFLLERTNGNYTVNFSYPNSWTNFDVLKNDNPLVHGVDYFNNTAEKTITIFNDTVTFDSLPWKITAESPNMDIDFTGPPETSAGSESLSSVSSPLNGTYIYLLYVGINERNRNTTEYNGDGSEVLSFPYIIPNSGPNGEWTAVMYWNNGTDAGVKTKSFTVSGGVTIISGDGGGGGGGSTTVTGLDPLLVLTVSIIIIAAIAGSLTSYQMVKRIKKKRDLQMQKLRNKVLDSLNLNYIMISENASGLNVFEQFFGGKEIDPTLISGFLRSNFDIRIPISHSKLWNRINGHF